jgi:hypothetical protein
MNSLRVLVVQAFEMGDARCYQEALMEMIKLLKERKKWGH